MMAMSKSVFFLYYGYWYTERLMEEREYEKREAKQKRQQKQNQPRQWKSFNGR